MFVGKKFVENFNKHICYYYENITSKLNGKLLKRLVHLNFLIFKKNFQCAIDTCNMCILVVFREGTIFLHAHLTSRDDKLYIIIYKVD